MSNRNDDIKQLFSHLGLNDQDYLELRRQSGGTEAERAKPQPEAEPRPEAPSPGATATPVGDTTRRFNAQTQPKVFLPGLTPDLGAPEQPPPPTVPRVRRPAPVVDAVAPTAPTAPAPAEPTVTRPARRWAMVDAATAPSADKVASVRAPTPAHSPAPAPQAAPAAPAAPAAGGARPWAGLNQRPLSRKAPPAAAGDAVERGHEAAAPATGLQQVIARLAHPEMTTDRGAAPQLHYAPRPLAGTGRDEAPAESSDLGAVFGRLSRTRQ